MITLESILRLRPSVAMVPVGDEKWQFFQGNTRRSRFFKLEPALANAIKILNGHYSLASAARLSMADPLRLMELAKVLHSGCLLEDAHVAERIAELPWRRVINFLGDYIPSHEVEDAFLRLSEKTVVMIGLGGVGSWVATQLCQSGFEKFILVDDDEVELSNLNRSLYSRLDVGKNKVEALAERMRTICPRVYVRVVKEQIQNAKDLAQLIANLDGSGIVVNCADTPSVDATSSIVDEACSGTAIPYVIAGGYNLHLSLIGMTVLPGKTACYHCGRLTLEELQGDHLIDMRKLARPWRNIGNLAPLAAITASFAANEVIRLAVSDRRVPPAMINRRGEFNFLTGEMHFVSLPARRECGCIPW